VGLDSRTLDPQNGVSDLVINGIVSSQDCCDRCARTTGCAGSFWFIPDHSCTHWILVDASKCAPHFFAGAYYDDSDYKPNQGLIVSNGFCGYSTETQQE